LASKVSQKLGYKIGIKVLAGFAICLGPLIAGGINIYFIRSLSEKADRYYSEQQKIIERF
jgi:hypothetical protein